MAADRSCISRPISQWRSIGGSVASPRHVMSLWDQAWAEFVPFQDDGPHIGRVIYRAKAIEM
jgi:hypothetical protein